MDILDELENLKDEEELEALDELDEFDDVEIDEDDDFDAELLLSDDEVEYQMSEAKARELTDAIRAHATATYVLLAEAHKGKAYKALGYETWAAYVEDQFDISASRSYQLLDLSRVVQEIEAAAPEGTEIKITEAQARDIKRELPRITKTISEETEGLDPEEAAEAVDRIVDEAREQKRLEDNAAKKKQEALEEAEQEGYRKGVEAAADALLEADAAGSMTDNADSEFVELEVEGDGTEVMTPQQKVDLYNFLNVLSGLTSLPEPEDFLASIPKSRVQEIANQLQASTAWLNRFSTLFELENE